MILNEIDYATAFSEVHRAGFLDGHSTLDRYLLSKAGSECLELLECEDGSKRNDLQRFREWMAFRDQVDELIDSGAGLPTVIGPLPDGSVIKVGKEGL